MRWAALLSRWVIGAVFIYAAVPKLLDMPAFAAAIANYRMLPEVLVALVAAVLPGVELVTGAALVAGVGVRGGVILAEAMLLAFVVALIQGIVRGIDTSCGCFDTAQAASPIGWGVVGRDLVLMAMGVVAWMGLPKEAGEPVP